MQQNKNRDARRGRMWSLLASLALVTMSTACFKTSVVLELKPGSVVTVTPAGAPAPLSSLIVGNISNDVALNLNIGQALAGTPQMGSFTTTQVLIAGASIPLGPGMETGTICISLDQTKNNVGTATVDVLGGKIMLKSDVNAQIRFTNPAAAALIGGGPILFTSPLDAQFPVQVPDLIAALSGTPLPVAFMQGLMGQIAATVPAVGGAAVGGNFDLLSPPTATARNAMLEECRMFLASQGIMIDPALGAPVGTMAPAGPAAPMAPRAM